MFKLFLLLIVVFATKVNLMLPLVTVNSNGLVNREQLKNDFWQIQLPSA